MRQVVVSAGRRRRPSRRPATGSGRGAGAVGAGGRLRVGHARGRGTPPVDLSPVCTRARGRRRGGRDRRRRLVRAAGPARDRRALPALLALQAMLCGGCRTSARTWGSSGAVILRAPWPTTSPSTPAAST